jgi:hypothetical protein
MGVAMKFIKWLILTIAAAIFFCALPSISFAQDPGLPDSLIIDSVFVPYNPGYGAIVNIPVYFVTDDPLYYLSMTLKIDSPDSTLFFTPVIWRYPFTAWDDASYTFTSQSSIRILLFCDLGGPSNPPLNTGYQRLQGFDLNITIPPQAQPQFALIDTVGALGYISRFKPGYIRYGDVSAIDSRIANPEKYYLLQNYPNPFNSQTVIEFEISQPSPVRLQIFDITGARIATLIDNEISAGKHSVTWDASDYPSGVYYYRLIAGNFRQTQKMLMIK